MTADTSIAPTRCLKPRKAPLCMTPDDNEQQPKICIENFELLAHNYKPLLTRYVNEMYRTNSRRIEKEDLMQMALLALMDAIRLFNPERGIHFSVYLRQGVKNKLACFCRDSTPGYYVKDEEKPGRFKRKRVSVQSLDAQLDQHDNHEKRDY